MKNFNGSMTQIKIDWNELSNLYKIAPLEGDKSWRFKSSFGK